MANHLRPVPRAYLIDGYISFTFGFQTAEHYMARIFKLDPRSSQLLRMAPSTSLIILRVIIHLLIWYMDKTPGLSIILPLAGLVVLSYPSKFGFLKAKANAKLSWKMLNSVCWRSLLTWTGPRRTHRERRAYATA